MSDACSLFPPFGDPGPSCLFSSVIESCLTLCDRMNRSTPGLPVHHQLPEFTQTHVVHRVSDAIQPSHPLLSPSPLALSLAQHQGLFQWVGSSHHVAKYWSFSFSPSNEYTVLISFRIDWLDLLAVQGTLKSLLQHHRSKASILWCSAFFMVQLSLTIRTFVSKVMSLLFNTLSRFIIAFLPRSKHLSWLQSCQQWFWTQEKKLSLLPLFPLLFAMKWWSWMPWSSLFICWILSQLFHSPLLHLPRDS